MGILWDYGRCGFPVETKQCNATLDTITWWLLFRDGGIPILKRKGKALSQQWSSTRFSRVIIRVQILQSQNVYLSLVVC